MQLPQMAAAAVGSSHLSSPAVARSACFSVWLSSLYDTLGISYEPRDYAGTFSSISEDEDAGAEASGAGRPAHAWSFHFGYKNWLCPNGWSVPWSIKLPAIQQPSTTTGTVTAVAPSSSISMGSIAHWARALWDSLLILIGLALFFYRARRDNQPGGLLRRREAETSSDKNGLQKGETTASPGQAFSPLGDRLTFQSYLALSWYPVVFLQRMLFPTLAGILTCSHGGVARYPAALLVEYLQTRSMGGVRHVTAGTQEVVAKLAAHLPSSNIRLGTRVERVEIIQPSDAAAAGGRRLRVRDSAGGVEEFDHVILACQANQAARIFAQGMDDGAAAGDSGSDSIVSPSSSPFAALRASLNAIPYESSQLVLHTDSSVMHPDRSLWGSVNFVAPTARRVAAVAPAISAATTSDGAEPGPAATTSTSAASVALPSASLPLVSQGGATIWLNRSQSCLSKLPAGAAPDLFQSWNLPPQLQPRADSLICQGSFERPVVTPASLASLRSLQSLQGQHGVWLCGSYALRACPLLESAVTSAMQVAQQIGCPPPWDAASAPQHAQHGSAWSASSLLLSALLALGLALLAMAQFA